MTPQLYQCPTCLITAVAYVPPRAGPPLCRSPRHPRIEQMHEVNETGEAK